MEKIIPLIGVFLCLIVFACALLWSFRNKIGKGRIGGLGLCLVVGLGLFWSNYLKELSFPGYKISLYEHRAASGAERIDEIRQWAEKQFKSLEDKNEMAEKKIGDVDSKLKEASKLVSDLEVSKEFIMSVIGALSDNRKSLDQLEAWALDSSYPLSAQARQAWESTELLNLGLFMGYKVPWEMFNVSEPAKLSVNDLWSFYKQSPSPVVRLALVEYAWKRTDIPRKARLQFLIDVIRSDSSVKVLIYSLKRFVDDTKARVPFEPGCMKYVEAWWSHNKESLQ